MEENSSIEKPSVMSVSLRYGGIMAVASIAFMMILIAMGANPFENDWKGWISSLITVGILVMAHKYFKDNGDGYMSYGQGLGIGFISILISIVVGGIFSYVYANFIDLGIMEDLWQKTTEKMQAQGQSEDTIETAMSWTKKLFWVFYFIGGAFVALIIALIVSIFTQKKNPEPFA